MLSLADQKTLLQIARQSIEYTLAHHGPAKIRASDYPAALQALGASFVTLTLAGQLRGCIGSIEARRSLAEDVCANAYSSAFHDPRFAPLTQEEKNVHIAISVLSPPQPLPFSDQRDLLEKIRPRTDGLILEDGYHRGVFLPSVWESLPDKNDFLQHLKIKAGLPSDYWSDTVKILRFDVQYIEE